VLSGNAWSPVQGLAVQGTCRGPGIKGQFWSTQYHTEFSLQDVALLALLAKPLLVKQVWVVCVFRGVYTFCVVFAQCEG
jgi:hypothetical protein